MRVVNILIFFILAPFLGMGMALWDADVHWPDLLLPSRKMSITLDVMSSDFASIRNSLGLLADLATEQESKFREQQQNLGQLAEQVVEHKLLSDKIYEDRILAMLGPAVHTHKSSRVEIKIFELKELGYRGYIAKVKLFNPNALKVVLAQDKLGEKETTLEAVQRKGAIFGINGGGFYSEMRDGKPYAVHIGNTMIDGKLIGPFNPYPEDLFFAGINRSGKFIGGIFPTIEQLMALDPWQGVSFIPVLMKGGVPLPVHEDWKATKQPRTIIGSYANDDLIMIVVDGRQSDWSSGVTLERLLEKLAELGVKDAYNLDGGGSSTMVFNGKVLNRPSDGKPRPVVTNFVIFP